MPSPRPLNRDSAEEEEEEVGEAGGDEGGGGVDGERERERDS